jgi:LysM repeat protein
MRKTILSLIVLCGFSAPAFAAVSGNALKADAPDRYVVVKGDTLWGISKKFLKDPWKWPELWGLNKDQVKNPHLIYPGQMLVLEKRADGSAELKAGGLQTVKLEPHTRVEPSSREAVPSVPPSLIEPFLSKPLVVEDGVFESAARIAGGGDQRVVFGSGDAVYATGINPDRGRMWHVYRKGRPLIDPDTGQSLGFEAIYLGDARVINFGPVSKLDIVYANQEINQNDALTPSPGMVFSTYAPHAPSNPVSARIIAAYGGLAEVGQNAIVSINRGATNGLEKGNVLAVYRNGETLKTDRGNVTLPGDRIGLLFVFRTFDRVSYALVAESTRPIHVGDVATNP